MDDFCDYLMDWLQQEDQPLPSMYTRLVQLAVLDHKKKVVIVTYGPQRSEKYVNLPIGSSTWDQNTKSCEIF